MTCPLEPKTLALWDELNERGFRPVKDRAVHRLHEQLARSEGS
ncbi:hypothetical protein [Brachybacterium sp. FME24]|nr:hypothetical protein [Brachybacterium sp. FME24]